MAHQHHVYRAVDPDGGDYMDSMGDTLNAASKPAAKFRASYLTVQQQFNLQHACRLLTASFGMCTYHVGSSLERPDWRDVDLRCILDDVDYDAFIGKNQTKLRFLNVAISEWLGARTGLPIDFQFQRQTEANAEFEGRRNAVGFPLDKPIAQAV